MMNKRETDTHSAALRDLNRAETYAHRLEAELSGMTQRLRQLIDAGAVSEGAGEFIRTGATDQRLTGPSYLESDVREALVR
jgi:hypothetical protein